VKKNHTSLNQVRALLTVTVTLASSCLPLNAAFTNAPALSPAATSVVADPATDSLTFSGKVVETTNAANYTYVLVDTGKQKHWAAAPQFQVKVGDPITIEDGMPMPNYHSKSLNRDFEVVYFSGSALVGDAQKKSSSSTAALPQGHPPIPGTTDQGASLPKGHPPLTSATADSPKIDVSGIKKAEGGKTVAEIFAARTQLAGKQVKVRGKVVKYNPMIMGKNWVHVQDGSGTEGSNDLTLTTATAVKIGATIVATGTIAIDKDFGHGYTYGVILEDAKIVTE